jgi:glycine reductase complex component B subunit gamma
MTPIAVTVGSNRVIPGGGILHPVGNAGLNPEEERRFRRKLVEQSLEALKTKLAEQKLFPRL